MLTKDNRIRYIFLMNNFFFVYFVKLLLLSMVLELMLRRFQAKLEDSQMVSMA